MQDLLKEETVVAVCRVGAVDAGVQCFVHQNIVILLRFWEVLAQL